MGKSNFQYPYYESNSRDFDNTGNIHINSLAVKYVVKEHTNPALRINSYYSIFSLTLST